MSEPAAAALAAANRKSARAAEGLAVGPLVLSDETPASVAAASAAVSAPASQLLVAVQAGVAVVGGVMAWRGARIF